MHARRVPSAWLGKQQIPAGKNIKNSQGIRQHLNCTYHSQKWMFTGETVVSGSLRSLLNTRVLLPPTHVLPFPPRSSSGTRHICLWSISLTWQKLVPAGKKVFCQGKPETSSERVQHQRKPKEDGGTTSLSAGRGWGDREQGSTDRNYTLPFWEQQAVKHSPNHIILQLFQAATILHSLFNNSHFITSWTFNLWKVGLSLICCLQCHASK